MQFGTGHARNCFRTPSLYGDSRPLVPRGGTADLGDMFVMRPGYVNGQIILQGPPEVGGFRSPLRYVRTASDMSEEAWLTRYYSSVEARGTDAVAAGATESTYEGVGVTEIDGAFDGDFFPVRKNMYGNKNPEQLRIAYLCGPEPENDLEILINLNE